MQTYVEKEPERFARLALRFPSDTNHAYFDHVLMGLEKASLPSDLKLAVCRKAYVDCRDSCGGAVASLLGKIEDPLPDDAVEMLDWLATQHPEPDKEHWKIMVGDKPYYGGDMHGNGINTTRGKAAGAIRDLILRDSAYLKRFEKTLIRMVQDPSPSVLSCVAGTLRAVAYHDTSLALSLFARMNISEDRLLATTHVYELVRGAIPNHFAQVRPLIERTLRSNESDVAEAGGRLAALSTLHHSEAAVLELEAFRGRPRRGLIAWFVRAFLSKFTELAGRRGYESFPTQRLGVSQVASANIAAPECRDWCERRLKSLFNDDDEAVRREAATCFRYLESEALEAYSGLISAFCDSQAFQDDSFSLLHVLEQSLRRLPGMTCIVCEKFLERFSDEARDIRTSRMGDAHTVTELLFRTYQQHQQDEWTSRALDLIDRLCLENIGEVNDGFREFER